MIKVYGVLRSRATRPVWVLMESNTPFDLIPVIQGYRLPDPLGADAPLNTASPDFLAINPQGQVPCITDGDLVLTESMATALYLAKVHGGDLGPQNAAEDGQITQWAFVGATGVETYALDILYTYAKNETQTEDGAAKIALAADHLHRPFARIDAHLAQNKWLVGDRFTVADICLAECVRYAQPHAPLMDGYPALVAWLARCQSRPAFVAMMEQRNAELA